MELLSTSALAKKLEIVPKQLFEHLAKIGYIQRQDTDWILTTAGKDAGGSYKTFGSYGKKVVWPADIDFYEDEDEQKESQGLLNATKIGESFGVSSRKINALISELGWMKKEGSCWKLTKQGTRKGAKQFVKSGNHYVKWPESILTEKLLIESLNSLSSTKIDEQSATKISDFRQQLQAKLRTTDGHFVRSKAEMLIDNWLYMAEIPHAYERKLPIEEEVYSDFYIPTGKVYIEYWGYENNEKYLARKAEKLEIYKKYDFNLIELNDKDVENMDDILPVLLLKYGVKSY